MMQGSNAQDANSTMSCVGTEPNQQGSNAQDAKPKQQGRRFSTKEASEFLGGRPKPGTLLVWRSTGAHGIPYMKVGRSVFYLEADLINFQRKYERYISTESKQNHE